MLVTMSTDDKLLKQSNCKEKNILTGSNSSMLSVNCSSLPNAETNSDLEATVTLESANEIETCESEIVTSSESHSKVIVQVLPKVEFGNITALLDCSTISGLSHKFWGNKSNVYNSTEIRSKVRLYSHESDDDSSWEEESISNAGDFSRSSSVFSDEENLSPRSTEFPVQKFEKENVEKGGKDLGNDQKDLGNNQKDLGNNQKDLGNGQTDLGNGQKNLGNGQKDLGNEEKDLEKDCTSKSFVNANKDINSSKEEICKEYIGRGKGVKLYDIEHVSSEIAIADAKVIRVLHYIIFGTYGLIGNEHQLYQSKQRILEFNGFPFDEESEIYQKKQNCLQKLPNPLLSCICNILMKNTCPLTKFDTAAAVITFLREPPAESPEEYSSQVQMPNEVDLLKKKALEALPCVILERLNINYIDKMIHKEELQHSSNTNAKSPPVTKRVLQLKDFPKMVINIQNTRRRIINLLHLLLFGRPGSNDSNRQNILEFSGFRTYQKSFAARKLAFLNRLKLKELSQLCDVFTLRVKSANKGKKIKKLLSFLQKPGDILNKTTKKLKDLQEKHSPSSLTESPVHTGMLNKKRPQRLEKSSKETSGVSDGNIPIRKLRDFENIRSNVECATPEDLTELNDLLYVKPCDNSEIHQKILDFTPFIFDINSFDFHYRRTLMHYMDFKTVKKIAQLLSIEDWENKTSIHDLTLCILKFLMDMKLPEKKRKSTSNLNSKKKQRPHILKFNSYSNDKRLSTSRSHTPEPFDSTYGSEEINDNENRINAQTSISSHGNTPSSRSRHRKNGLSIKQEQILNDATPLHDFIQHPTEGELQVQIDKIISRTCLSISMGDLVKEVLNCYPNFNLQYRIDFIKAKTLEILQELRQNTTVFPE